MGWGRVAAGMPLLRNGERPGQETRSCPTRNGERPAGIGVPALQWQGQAPGRQNGWGGSCEGGVR